MTMTPAEIKALVADARGVLEKRHPGLFNPDDPLDLAEYPGLKNLSTEWIARLLVEAIESTALRSFMDGGWRLVPVDDPTEEMLVAGHDAGCEAGEVALDSSELRAIWSAMLRASPLPTPPAVEGEAGE